MSTCIVDDVTCALWEYQGRMYYDFGFSQMREAVERVNRGATLLDEKKPDWSDEIAPRKLDMSSGMFCIIGQAYGEYEAYIGVPFGHDVWANEGVMNPLAIQNGFLSEEDEDRKGVPYALLDRVWVYLLSARATVGRPVTLELPETPLPRNTALLLLRDKQLLEDEAVWNAQGDRYDN